MTLFIGLGGIREAYETGRGIFRTRATAKIEQLNQRGGRMLSIMDLIQAGTISVPMAAYAMRAMHQGASLLTAARPGGAARWGACTAAECSDWRPLPHWRC